MSLLLELTKQQVNKSAIDLSVRRTNTLLYLNVLNLKEAYAVKLSRKFPAVKDFNTNN